MLLVNHCLLGSCSGKRPYGQLVVTLRRVSLLADQGSDQAAEEPGRYRDQPGITQQEPVEVRTRDQRRRCAGHNRPGEKVANSTAESASSCMPAHFDVLGEDQYPHTGMLLTDRQGGSRPFLGVRGRQSDIDDDRIGRILGYPYQ